MPLTLPNCRENVQTLDAADLSRDGPASLSVAMDSQLGSVNINANLDDQIQPDILYRGFEASPVLGTPQGLAVYQNGVRINEAFGDTPELAIDDEVWNAAFDLARRARAAGISVPATDILIAACARRHEVELEHADSDFFHLECLSPRR
jgi:hypothetical protein